MRRAARRARGFSLIEVMVVVAIVGVVASVAVPTYARMTVRSKTAERPIVMNAILRGIEDVYRRNGSVLLNGNPLNGTANPVTYGVTKQTLNAGLSADWALVLNSVRIDGTVYHSYAFSAAETGFGPNGTDAGATIVATGDLDGDGAPSIVTLTCVRKDGAYQCTQAPAPGSEDQSTF
jgi:type IV pilus assembly protein PilA